MGTQAGQSLCFYMKYCDTMDVLYSYGHDSEQDKEIDGIFSKLSPERQDVILNQVQRVGDIACDQAAELFQRIGKGIEAVLEHACGARISSQRKKMKKEWEVLVHIWPLGHERPSQKKRWVGCCYDPESQSLVCFAKVIWGPAKEERLADVLRGKLAKRKPRGSERGWVTGTVCIAESPLEIDSRSGDITFDIDTVVRQVADVFASLSKDEVTDMLRI